ncbi:MAG: hypothetical protein E7286_09300 [Lachnospiraceae bacterium]|nr:hypothetical protein [Lachnospiraceae bacterium]
MENVIVILEKIWMAITVVFRFLKSKFGLIILVVLAIVGGFTYLSYRNYIKNLPIVTLTSSVNNAIRTQMETTGTLYYNEVLEVSLPQGCHVEEVFVGEGDAVETDMPLLRMKVADLQVARLNKQLQIEALEEVEEVGGTEGELAYWKKELLLEEVSVLEELIKAEGVVKAEGLPETESNSAGEETTINPVRIIKQAYKKGDLTSPDVPITMGLPEGGCYLEWQISAKDYKDYKGTACIRTQKENLTWEAPKFANGVYIYRSLVDTPEKFVHGEQIKIELNYVSESHKAVLPRACIRTDADGSTYVYQVDTRTRNYGEEQYVRKLGVTIIEQDDINVAIKGSVYDVVLGSFQQLQDLMTVIVISE